MLATPACDISVVTMQKYSSLVVPAFQLLSIKYELAALKYRVGEMRQNCLMVLKWSAGLALFFLVMSPGLLRFPSV